MNNTIEVNSSISDKSVSFFIINNNSLALSELTKINEMSQMYAELIKNKSDRQLFLQECKESESVYFYSRLKVPPKMQNEGIGRILLDKTLSFCKENNSMLINTVNPYGDLNLKQLNKFYEGSGMKLLNENGFLVYSKNINLKKFLKPKI